MTVHFFESPLDFQDFAAEPLVDPSHTVSGAHLDGLAEVNLGAFRGLAFALIFEIVFVILGGLAWHVFRTFAH
jgi:hypothetical protein